MAMYELNPSSYQYIFSAQVEPKLRIKSGDVVLVHTNDAAESRILCREDLPSKAMAGVKFTNPQSGPIYVEDAKEGDTLAVTIESIEYTRPFAFSAHMANLGALCPTALTPMLNDPIPEAVFIWEVEDGGKSFYERELDIRIPAAPFMGTFAVAPLLESIQALTPGPFGGNMDVPDVCVGNTIYLPVFNDGAYFTTGDCHGAQGQGELCGFALEITAKVQLRFEVIKKTIRNPRIESPDKLMCVGNARPMEDAARIATMELIRWMVEDYGFTKYEAFQLLTQVGGLYVGNMVDTVYSLVASIDKRFLKRCSAK